MIQFCLKLHEVFKMIVPTLQRSLVWPLFNRPTVSLIDSSKCRNLKYGEKQIYIAKERINVFSNFQGCNYLSLQKVIKVTIDKIGLSGGVVVTLFISGGWFSMLVLPVTSESIYVLYMNPCSTTVLCKCIERWHCSRHLLVFAHFYYYLGSRKPLEEQW